MFAVIETGGKQYQVREGDTVYIEKLDLEPDSKVTFDKVIALKANDSIKVGTPYVENAVVKATLIKNGKGKKITVFTYKAKKSKRKMGHRQPYSCVKIDAITG